MAKPGPTTSEQIARQLAASLPPGMRCRVTSAQVRTWAREYLADCEAEAEEPPHSTLWMDDGGDKVGPGHFAVIIFWPRPRGLEFFSDVGISLPVQDFCEHDEPDDLNELYEAMAAHFVVGRLLRAGGW